MQITMSRPGAKRKFKGSNPGRQNVRRTADDQLAAMQPHRRWLPEGQQLSAKALTVLGQMNLQELITNNQYEAGCRFGVVVGEYRASIGIPMQGHANGANTFRCMGEVRCEDCECRRRKERYDRAYDVLFGISQRVAKAVANVAIHERQCQSLMEVEHLKVGLSALSIHYGLEGRRSVTNVGQQTQRLRQ